MTIRQIDSFRGIGSALLIISIALVGGVAPTKLHAADKLRVSNCYIGGAILPLWMAQDTGFYEREGLDVEQIWIQGNPATAALIAGEIDALYCIPHNTISAIAGGADLLFVASIYNRMQYRIIAGPGIDKMEQLRGKVVGVARLHDVAHFYLRLALKRFGMSDRDVQMAAVGGQNDRVLALKNGRVAATILNPANALVLEKSGFKTILDIDSLNFPVIGNAVAARRAMVKEPPSSDRKVCPRAGGEHEENSRRSGLEQKSSRAQSTPAGQGDYRRELSFQLGEKFGKFSNAAVGRLALRHRFADSDRAECQESEGGSAG